MTASPLSPAEALARLRLIRSDQVGPLTFRQLLRRFGTAAAAVEALPDLAGRAGRAQYRVADLDAANRELERAAKLGCRMLHWGEAGYPALLAEIEDAPPVLTVRGRAELLEMPAVAIVGARNASAAGRRIARLWAAELAEAGVAVVSGLARGIDADAHTGALPATIAAVAGGADVAYPPELAALSDRIAAEGLIVAEQPLGTEPQARHFPRRNRVISGLSLGVVVIEAALRSGSLITARFAGDHGREVMACPGNPLDPRSAGGNALIRDGATLVTSAADILECTHAGVAAQRGAPATETGSQPVSTGDADSLLSLLGPAPVMLDELAAAAGMSAAAAGAVLTDLEIEGRIVRHAGGRIALAP
ncbi:MAG: DNA-processing protein DprA [Sphingomonadaceae bacterium]|nr:DNA-processing protein DprA [Sphingomonadaceae bacterium]